MTDKMTVIQLTKQNACDIELIEKACFAHPWSEKSILESFDNSTYFFGVMYNKDIIGYCGLQTVCDEGYITNIAVLNAHRKKGAGKMLINQLIDFAQQNKLSFITLEVRVSNNAAISLYSKFGFENMGVRKNFYRDPIEDAYIMTRQM